MGSDQGTGMVTHGFDIHLGHEIPQSSLADAG